MICELPIFKFIKILQNILNMRGKITYETLKQFFTMMSLNIWPIISY